MRFGSDVRRVPRRRLRALLLASAPHVPLGAKRAGFHVSRLNVSTEQCTNYHGTWSRVELIESTGGHQF
jgi:hypothetical protein